MPKAAYKYRQTDESIWCFFLFHFCAENAEYLWPDLYKRQAILPNTLESFRKRYRDYPNSNAVTHFARPTTERINTLISSSNQLIDKIRIIAALDFNLESAVDVCRVYFCLLWLCCAVTSYSVVVVVVISNYFRLSHTIFSCQPYLWRWNYFMSLIFQPQIPITK